MNMNGKLLKYIRFNPNEPKQNPVEDIWLHAKKFVFVREFIICVIPLLLLKGYLKIVTHHQVSDFSKIFMYNSFSLII